MYAVIETGGKQYTVREGDLVKIEKVEANKGDTYVFDKVLLISNDGEVQIGKPYIESKTIEAEVLDQGKHKKVITYKYNAKKNYRKKKGHRQPFTLVRIGKIA